MNSNAGYRFLTVFILTTSIVQACDSELSPILFSLFSAKLRNILILEHENKIQEKYNKLEDSMRSQCIPSETEDCSSQIEQLAELEAQRRQEIESAPYTAYSNPQVCKNERVIRDLNSVIDSKRQFCNPLDPEKSPSLAKSEIERELQGDEDLVACKNLADLNSYYQQNLPANSMNLPNHRICEIALQANNNLANECPKPNQQTTSRDPNSCEIPGPDGRCPGAPVQQFAPLSARDQQDIYFLQNGTSIQQQRQKLRNSASGR